MVPPAPPTGYTVELIPGGDAVGYPSLLAQGYPGGYTIRSNKKPSIDGLSWGGGGGGGAGGAGYNLTPYNPPSDNPKYHMPSTNCRGGNGAPHPEFSAAVLSYINGFPTDTYQKIGPHRTVCWWRWWSSLCLSYSTTILSETHLHQEILD